MEKKHKHKHKMKSKRAKRQAKLPARLNDYKIYTAYCLCANNDPQSYQEACKQDVKWQEAINKELEAHEKFNTWTPATIPPGQKPIDTKWVFRTKIDGTKKARLVAKGFQEEEKAFEVYAPVARMSTVQLMLMKALNQGLTINQLDIPTAFLNGKLETDIYINTPEGVKTK